MDKVDARHLTLAREIGAWWSSVAGPWFTDTGMAVRTPEPFARPMTLYVNCSCDDEAAKTHGDTMSAPCVYVDDYYSDPAYGAQWLGVLEGYAALESEPTLEGYAFEHPEMPGVLCHRIELGGGRWVAVDKKYVDLATRVATPERWDVRHAVTRSGIQTPLLVGTRDGEMVAAMAAMAVPGSLRSDPVLRHVPRQQLGRTA